MAKKKTSLKEYYGDYTADVIFKRGVGYMTQKQAKELKDEQVAVRDWRRENAGTSPGAAASFSNPANSGGGAVPIPGGTPSAPTGTPTGLGGPITIGNEPSWWIPQAYQNPNADQSFANAANAILPTLSPEDRRTMANYLATNFKDVFGGYATADMGMIPTKLGTERNEYLNPARAQTALNLLERVKTASGGAGGPGYDFLKQAVNLMNQFSNQGSPMTREQYQLFQTAFKNLSQQQGKDLSAYTSLAQMFGLPSFTAGPLVSNAPSSRLNY